MSVKVMRAIALLLCLVPMAGQSRAQDISSTGAPTSSERLATAEVTVVNPTKPAEVRMIYLVPADREFQQFSSNAIERSIKNLQIFYRNQIGGGVTFRLHTPVVESYKSSHPVTWYQTNPGGGFWNNVLSDVFQMTGGGFNDPVNRWVIYIDSNQGCNQPGPVSGGTSGVALLPRNDLLGVAGLDTEQICPSDPIPPKEGVCRWIGGLGHELGHAFNLPHPPGCDQPIPGVTCPYDALMYAGYASYPNTYLLPQDKLTLKSEAFFTSLNLPADLPACTPGPPFGSFDTPANNSSGISGAIPVTGWALDDIEVASVGIWREPIGNEVASSNGLVFISNATLVAGARPDVETRYPNVPMNYRAGWGYMLLTNFLPNTGGAMGGGNGTYKLHAIAVNYAGTQVDLGTRAITVDNAHASKPFGTIDTPGQGDTVSGNAYVNFGWALTQNPYCIPIDGSKLAVYVDSVPVGRPVYNQMRSDIATFFPGLCNTNGAVGFFYLDTTKLSNGVHTISWVVYDNQGRGDGIGSRYFTVSNTGMANAPEFEQPIELAAPETVSLRRGFDLRSEMEQLKPDAAGEYSIEIEELGRLELQVGATTGHLLVNGEYRPLPLGSSIKGRVFYWNAGPGFLGDYSLVFHRPDRSEVHLLVHIRPTNYSRANNR